MELKEGLRCVDKRALYAIKISNSCNLAVVTFFPYYWNQYH